ncbi:hypothetical protein GLAREA_00145 [Glarea lozoyensis ATCC 20868]|uniref:Noranthrone monooxygenase n=1 Tax=Glarea lozoyensis (strain ATCC 20868 / MF5171) TaxID=1116229 RepID=S3CR99_GLAL2|nr:uncharacterized protein GLAREA_00145 [Glarea lozoyensis ATCC 20868]EPE28987.1 hypothetical protein GLAREA_00145 [Glarea lozoyensis ATCC 20868]
MNTLHIHPPAIRTAQAIGLTGSAILAGASLVMSFINVPTFLLAPAPVLVKQWKHNFIAGRAALPLLSVISAGANFYLYSRSAYTLPSYLFAGLTSVGIIPYTVVFMRGVNGRLMGMAEGVEEGEMGRVGSLESVHELVDWWGVLQLGRTGLVCVSAVLNVWNVFC